jgi:hypothetical protein
MTQHMLLSFILIKQLGGQWEITIYNEESFLSEGLMGEIHNIVLEQELRIAVSILTGKIIK